MSKLYKIYYTLEPKFDDYLNLEIAPSNNDELYEDIELYVAECAEDYYYDHDGTERSWPMTIWIWENESTLIGSFSVDMEPRAKFYASRIEDE
jgi:hypothetical protein